MRDSHASMSGGLDWGLGRRGPKIFEETRNCHRPIDTMSRAATPHGARMGREQAGRLQSLGFRNRRHQHRKATRYHSMRGSAESQLCCPSSSSFYKCYAWFSGAVPGTKCWNAAGWAEAASQVGVKTSSRKSNSQPSKETRRKTTARFEPAKVEIAVALV